MRAREKTVKEGLRVVWEKSKAECTCLAERIAASSQGAELDEQCPYCIGEEEGADVPTMAGPCPNEECNTCELINKLDRVVITALGCKRNERMREFFNLAPCLARLLNSGEVPEDRRKPLVESLCNLLCCSPTKLRYLANIGFLIMLCPRLRYLYLEKGWGIVYNNLSKIASAIGYHDEGRSQLAALVFLREQCIPDRENKWRWYLQSEVPEEEGTILGEVFEGCFQLDEQAEQVGQGEEAELSGQAEQA